MRLVRSMAPLRVRALPRTRAASPRVGPRLGRLRLSNLRARRHRRRRPAHARAPVPPGTLGGRHPALAALGRDRGDGGERAASCWGALGFTGGTPSPPYFPWWHVACPPHHTSLGATCQTVRLSSRKRMVFPAIVLKQRYGDDVGELPYCSQVPLSPSPPSASAGFPLLEPHPQHGFSLNLILTPTPTHRTATAPRRFSRTR